MLDYMIQQFLLALISRNLVPFSNKTSQFLDQNMLMPVIALNPALLQLLKFVMQRTARDTVTFRSILW